MYKELSLLSEWKTQYSFSEKLRFPFTCTFVLFTISPYSIRAGANFDASLSPILKCVFYSLVIAFFIHYLYVSFTHTPSKYKGLCHFFLFYTFPALYTYIYIIIKRKHMVCVCRMLRNYVTCNLYIYSQPLKRRKISSVATT